MTFTIHRYPVHLIDVIRLPAGNRITVRPALPQDAELYRIFVRSLSDRARHYRFMTTLRSVSAADAKQFTSIDYRSHVALVATTFAGDREAMIGEARYIADEHDPTRCEFALAVLDSWQDLGLGRRLLRRLVSHAAASGFHLMAADTLLANGAMITLAEKVGFTAARNCQDPRLVHLAKTLDRVTSAVEDSSRGRRYRR